LRLQFQSPHWSFGFIEISPFRALVVSDREVNESSDSRWQHEILVCALRHERSSGRFSKSKGLSACVSFPSPPSPTETLATQATQTWRLQTWSVNLHQKISTSIWSFETRREPKLAEMSFSYNSFLTRIVVDLFFRCITVKTIHSCYVAWDNSTVHHNSTMHDDTRTPCLIRVIIQQKSTYQSRWHVVG